MAFDDDKRVLVGILLFVRKVLEELVEGHVSYRDRELFAEVWNGEIRPRLDELAGRIEATRSDEDALWHRLQEHGLTGGQLRFKQARLAAVSGKGVKGKILDIINTILGSIPGADPIKEFKEFTEEAIEDPDAPLQTRYP